MQLRTRSRHARSDESESESESEGGGEERGECWALCLLGVRSAPGLAVVGRGAGGHAGRGAHASSLQERPC